MTQFSMGLMACQTESKFAKAYADGVHKSKYWEYAYEDIMDLWAKIPEIAAIVYRHTYADGVVTKDTSLDWSGNFCSMLGMHDKGFHELMRLYLTIHTDHEGGNASAHTTHLVGSTLSDPFLAWAAGLNALAGPLHGLANQECLRWLKATQSKIDGEPTVEKITDFAKKTLAAGQVIPGFG